MKIEVEVANSKADFAMEVLQSLSFVKKANPQKNKNATLSAAQKEANKQKTLHGIKQAVKEINLIKQGKAKGRSLEEFLNEL